MRLFIEAVHCDHGGLNRLRAISVIKALHQMWRTLHPTYHGMIQYPLPRCLWAVRFLHGLLETEKGTSNWRDYFALHVRKPGRAPPWGVFGRRAVSSPSPVELSASQVAAGIVTNGHKLVIYGKKVATQRTKERVALDITKFGSAQIKEVLDGTKLMFCAKTQVRESVLHSLLAVSWLLPTDLGVLNREPRD